MRRRIVRVLQSAVPLFVIVLLSPLVWGLIYAFVEDVRWQTVWTTIWVFGGIWVGSFYHAKIVDDEMNDKQKE